MAEQSIYAGGVVSAGNNLNVGPSGGPAGYFAGNDTGVIDAFYAVNNLQSARTIKNVSGTTAVQIDLFDKSQWTSAKYMVQVVDSGNIHTEELMIIQDGTHVYISQYGIITNNGELGVFDGSISGGNVIITFTPTGASGNMTIQVVRQSILTGLESLC